MLIIIMVKVLSALLKDKAVGWWPGGGYWQESLNYNEQINESID